ncbi:phage tail tape measure protein [Bacillus sp. Hm123]|uniref:phage tail tape measure protein n=1 Tax=Bacillus sp. Hm123 TaxID=3450745 RepID=UPI003F42D730
MNDQASSVIENIQGRLDQLKGTVLTIGAAGGITGAGVLGGGISSMEQNARTSATTGIAVGDIKKMTNDIFYRDKAGNSREEVSLSIRNIAQQTDLRGNQLKTASEISNKIATIHEKDVPEVDRALSSMVKNFNIDSIRAGDNLAYVFKNAGDQYDDLLDTFNEYSSSFNDLKMAPEQVAAAFVAGTKGGARNFDDMADSMREFNIKRTEMTDDQVAAFKKVLGPKETTKMFKGFADGSYTGQEAMYRIADGLANIEDKKKRDAIATELIGTKYEDLKQPILDMASAIDDPIKATGELNKQFNDLRKNNPMTPISDAGRKVQGVLSDIGEKVITTVSPAFKELNKWLDSKEGKIAVKEMSDDVSSLAGAVSSILVPAAKGVVTHWGLIQTPLAAVVGGLVAVKTTSLLVVKPIKLIGKALDFTFGGNRSRGVDDVTQSMSRMERRAQNSTRSLSRVKSILKGVGKLAIPAGLAMSAWDITTAAPGKERNKAVGGTVGGIGGAAIGAAAGSLLGPAGTVAGGVMGGMAGNWIGEKLSGSFDTAKIKESWGSLQSWFNNSVWTPLSAAAGTATGWISEKFVSAKNGATTIWNTVSGWFTTRVWTPIKDGAINTINFATGLWLMGKQAISTIWGPVSTWFTEKIWTPISTGASMAAGWISTKFNEAKLWAVSSWQTASTWFNEFIWTPISTGASFVANGISTAFGTAKNWAVTTWQSVSTWFTETVWTPISSGAGIAIGWVSNKFDEAKSLVLAVWEPVGTWFTDTVWAPISTGATFVADSITGAFEGAWSIVEKVWSKVSGVWDKVKTFTGETIKAGSEVTGLKTSKQKEKKYANGGYINHPHLGLVGEAGPEMIIPLSASRRDRAMELYNQTGKLLGIRPYANGGLVGGKSIEAMSDSGASVNLINASIGVDSISGATLDTEGQTIGKTFVQSIESGVNSNVISLEDWKNRNIVSPMDKLVVESPRFGVGVTKGYASGQNGTATGTAAYLQTQIHSPFNSTVTQGVLWGSGMIGNFIHGMRAKKGDVSAEARALAKAVDSAFRSELGIASPARRMVENGYWSAMGVVKGFDSVDISKIAKSKAKDLMSSFGNYSGGGSAMARSAIMQALQITGMPMSWLDPLMMVAKHESGFNPNAINNWDINAKRGDPSVGLFQIIGETFKRWTLPGMNDRRNPLHSAVAAIRYINGRYGGIQNHPGVKSKSRGGGYKPYAQGGVITHDHIARVGEGGKREVIIPLEQHRSRALSLLNYAQQALGVDNKVNDEQMSTINALSGNRSSGGGVTIKLGDINFTGDNIFSNDMDAEKVGQIAYEYIEKKLEEEHFTRGEMAVYG